VISDPDVVGLLYLVTIACFIVALKFDTTLNALK